MPVASTALSRVAYVPEATWDTTPATPAFNILRRTGGQLATRKTTAVSEEITPDRNVREEFELGQDPEGSYDFELSYGSFDDIMAATLQSAWASNLLKVGATRSSFTFEERTTVGAAPFLSRFSGAEVDTLRLNFAARQRSTGSFSLLARKEILDTAIITGATYAAANTKPVITGVSASALAVAGVNPVPTLRSLSLNISNNIRRIDWITSKHSYDFGTGQCDITGELEAYFQSNALYQKVLDHGGGAISITVGATANEKYTFSVPAAKFLSGSRRLGGKNDDVMISIPFRAEYDATALSSLVITRAVA